MRILRKLNGSYQRISRDRHLIARQLGLSDPEYRLWDLLVASYGWDNRYEDSYERVEATSRDIAFVLNWSHSKVSRVMNQLKEKEFVRVFKQGVYEVLVIPERGKSSSNTEYKELLLKSLGAGVNRNHGYSIDSSLFSSSGSYIDSEEKKDLEVNQEDEDWYINDLQNQL